MRSDHGEEVMDITFICKHCRLVLRETVKPPYNADMILAAYHWTIAPDGGYLCTDCQKGFTA